MTLDDHAPAPVEPHFAVDQQLDIDEGQQTRIVDARLSSLPHHSRHRRWEMAFVPGLQGPKGTNNE